MKDFYSFHTKEEDCLAYYKIAAEAYKNVFKRCGLEALYTEASGGLFSPRSHEFQVLAEIGEDTIYYCPEKDYAYNKEIYTPEAHCPFHPKAELKVGRAIEVGNIFPLGTRFSEPMAAYFTDEHGARKPILMGCYGIGLGRTLATIVEVSCDDHGIIWPPSVAPYSVHLIPIISASEQEAREIKQKAKHLYELLLRQKVAVLYDDREGMSAGEKFAESDLLGIPLRIIISAKTLAKGAFEIKKRAEKSGFLVEQNAILQYV
jgi:prolyl-tRNA synthetase